MPVIIERCDINPSNALEWDFGIMEDQPETPLDLVRSYIAEGEARCARLTEMLEKMEAHAPLKTVQAADRLLAVLDRSLMLLREHLKQEEESRPPDAAA